MDTLKLLGPRTIVVVSNWICCSFCSKQELLFLLLLDLLLLLFLTELVVVSRWFCFCCCCCCCCWLLAATLYCIGVICLNANWHEQFAMPQVATNRTANNHTDNNNNNYNSLKLHILLIDLLTDGLNAFHCCSLYFSSACCKDFEFLYAPTTLPHPSLLQLSLCSASSWIGFAFEIS